MPGIIRHGAHAVICIIDIAHAMPIRILNLGDTVTLIIGPSSGSSAIRTAEHVAKHVIGVRRRSFTLHGLTQQIALSIIAHVYSLTGASCPGDDIAIAVIRPAFLRTISVGDTRCLSLGIVAIGNGISLSIDNASHQTG